MSLPSTAVGTRRRGRPLTFGGRLPGVDCQPALPPEEERLRMDVAAFVGFAERGPCDLPVVVEDINQFRAVFGADVLLATDQGVPVYAHLPGAVAAFFDNGGRRCYVVRVTGAGETVLAERRAKRAAALRSRLAELSGTDRELLVAALPAIEHLVATSTTTTTTGK